MFKVSPIFALFSIVSGVQIVFDKASDTNQLLQVTCPYQDDSDFWVYGNPRQPRIDIFPEKVGFWTSAETPCSLIYYGGSLPKPKKIILSVYMALSGRPAKMSISGSETPGGPLQDISHIDTPEGLWTEEEIYLPQLPGSGVAVLNFTLFGDGAASFVLVDKIIIDLGDGPIEPISITTDYLAPEHWPFNDCTYVDDFRTLGCPVDPLEESEPGYWSPCQEKACRIEYGTHPAVIPLSVRITGYVKNEGQIMVGIPVGSGENTSFIIIDTKSSNEGAWVDYVVNLRRHQEYKYGILLMHNGGTAVLDWVTFLFQDEDTTGQPTTQLPTTVPPTQPPTTTGGAGRIMSSFFSTLVMFVLRKVY